MKIVPKGKQVIGRLAITKVSERIVAPDATKGATKFVLVDAVSDEAAAAGYKVGDLVLPHTLNNIFLRGGLEHRAVFSHEQILAVIEGVDFSDLVDIYGETFIPSGAEAAA